MNSCRKCPKQEELALFPRWPRAKPHRRTEAEIKALVRFRDGYRCRECGMTAKEHYRRFHRVLEVHRIIPGSRYTVRGCVALCRKCHYSKPKSERGNFTWNGKRHGITVRLSPDLADAFDDFLDTHEVKPKYATVVIQVLRKHLSERGFYPSRRRSRRDDDD